MEGVLLTTDQWRFTFMWGSNRVRFKETAVHAGLYASSEEYIVDLLSILVFLLDQSVVVDFFNIWNAQISLKERILLFI